MFFWALEGKIPASILRIIFTTSWCGGVFAPSEMMNDLKEEERFNLHSWKLLKIQWFLLSFFRKTMLIQNGAWMSLIRSCSVAEKRAKKFYQFSTMWIRLMCGNKREVLEKHLQDTETSLRRGCWDGGRHWPKPAVWLDGMWCMGMLYNYSISSVLSCFLFIDQLKSQLCLIFKCWKLSFDEIG